jgi:hypothetical protein
MYPEAKTGKSRRGVLHVKTKGTTAKETTWSCSMTADSAALSTWVMPNTAKKSPNWQGSKPVNPRKLAGLQ